jgi:hypothetical protein
MLSFKTRLDRIGEIIGRGMDLAEAGMNLGLTIISTVGTAAQQKLAVPPGAAAPPVQPGAQPAAAPEQEGPPGYGITNRLPLAPGRPVSISFSVNNDGVAAPKEVTLHVEGFAGDRPDAVLPVGSLRVVPATATIAPMDFEKFVLEGAIPPDALPGIYQGAVRVVSDLDITIPVWLVIQPEPASGSVA